MKSFHNDSQSFIKRQCYLNNFSTDDTQNQINLKNTQKKVEKVSYLPDIKVNIILEANHKNKNDSDDSDNENNVNYKAYVQKRNIITYLKLPQINKVNDSNIKNVL